MEGELQSQGKDKLTLVRVSGLRWYTISRCRGLEETGYSHGGHKNNGNLT